MEETLRSMGDDTLDRLRKLEASSAETEKMAAIVYNFFLPRKQTTILSASGGTSSVQKYLDIGKRLSHKCRARATWRQYHHPWLRVRSFLRAAILADGRDWCVQTLIDFPAYVRAVGPWVYTTKSSAASVETHILGLRMAMRMNDIPVPDDFMTKCVREVTRRERTKAPHRRCAITVDEVRAIVKDHSKASAGAVKRMIACVIGIGFQCLLRWADMALIHITGIYWYHDGCVIVLPRRKNNQHTPELVAFADRGGKASLFKTFKAHCEAVAGRKMPIEGRCMDVNRFVFRRINHTSGRTWNEHRNDVLEMENELPIGRNTYSKYVVRFKYALKSVCGLTKEALEQFGMHSLRVGGDTWLFKANMPDHVRQRMGGWASAFSEKTYIRTLIDERLQVCKAMGI